MLYIYIVTTILTINLVILYHSSRSFDWRMRIIPRNDNPVSFLEYLSILSPYVPVDAYVLFVTVSILYARKISSPSIFDSLCVTSICFMIDSFVHFAVRGISKVSSNTTFWNYRFFFCLFPLVSRGFRCK